MMRLLKTVSSLIGSGARGFVALIGIAGISVALANYTMTQGAGTTFGSVIVGGVHYAQQFICDLTTPAQCASVSAAGRVSVDGSGVTQPVSGTLTANLGTLGGAATAANQTGGGQKTQVVDGSGNVSPAGDTAARAGYTRLTDGTNTAAVKGASTAAATTDPAIVVAISPNGQNANGQATASNSSPVVLAKNSGTGATIAGAAVGTAGSPATEVVSMQGVSGGTPVPSNPGTAANWGIGATGAAVPANGVYMGFNSGGNLTPPSATTPLPVNQTGPYPIGSTPYTASATGTTSATAATLAGAASVTTYICGFSIRANATAAATGNAVVSGTISGSLNFTQWTAPLASGLGVTEMIFSPCVPASAANTSIVVTSAAPGSGGTVSVSAWGYKL